MSRTTLNFWLDSLLLILFLALLWCSAILRFVFPPGPVAGDWLLWGYGYFAWHQFQFGLLCALALAVLLHVMLHWTWVCGVVASYVGRRRGGEKLRLDDGQRTLYGVALLIIVLHVVGLGVAAAWFTIQNPLN
jgi:hypothetical protein